MRGNQRKNKTLNEKASAIAPGLFYLHVEQFRSEAKLA
jgi:hypothetical protein